MAKAFTEGLKPEFKPITLIIETVQEAQELRDALGKSCAYSLYDAYQSEYEKQKEVIRNAIG